MSKYINAIQHLGKAKYDSSEVDVTDLISLLNDPDTRVPASKAIDEITRTRPTELTDHIETLQQYLDERPATSPLSHSLGRIGRTNQQAMTALADHLGDPASRTRKAAFNGLQITAETTPEAVVQTIPQIQNRFTDTDAVRYAAASLSATLAETNADFRETLIGNLKSDTPKIRGTAARALGKLTTTGVTDLSPAFATIREQLTDEKEIVRLDAVSALETMIEEAPVEAIEAVDQLRKMLRSSGIKEEVATLLGKIAAEDADVFRLLIEDFAELRIIDDHYNTPSQHAADALKRAAGSHPTVLQEYQQPLLDALEESHSLTQRYLAGVLMRAGKSNPEALEFAVDPLLDRIRRGCDGGIRWSTCQALMVLASTYPRIIETVSELLEDPYGTVKTAAAAAMDFMTRHQPEVVATDETAVDRLQTLALGRREAAKRAMVPLIRIADSDANTIAPLADSLVKKYQKGELEGAFITGLIRIARLQPALVLPLRDSLLEAVEDGEGDGDTEIYQLLGVLAAIDSDVLPRLFALADQADDPYNRYEDERSVVIAATETARTDVTAVSDHLDELIPLTRIREPVVRVKIAPLFGIVATKCCSAVTEFQNRYLDLIYDLEDLVRESITVGLGPVIRDNPDPDIIHRLERVFEVDGDRESVKTAGGAATALAFAGEATLIAPDALVDAITEYIDYSDRDEWQYRQSITALDQLNTERARSELRRIATDHDEWIARTIASDVSTPTK